MKIEYRQAAIEDAELLIGIYNASFYSDYIKYGECPAYGKKKEEMELSIKKGAKYIIICDDIPAGVIGFDKKEKGDYYLNCLCIIPEYQGKGIGTQAFRYMLSIYPDWKRITLVTPADKEQNIKFYTEKCGFNLADRERHGNVEVVNFYRNR